MGFACGAGVRATVPPIVSRQSAPRLASKPRTTGRVCEPGTVAAPKPRSRAALLVSRCLLAEPLPLETSLPAPTSKHTHLRLPPFSAPLAHWHPPGSTSPLGFPGGVGVGGKCRGSVTAESGRSESGGNLLQTGARVRRRRPGRSPQPRAPRGGGSGPSKPVAPRASWSHSPATLLRTTPLRVHLQPDSCRQPRQQVWARERTCPVV